MSDVSADKQRRLCQIVAAQIEAPLEEITPETGLGLHPKWDSMAHVSVIMAIEQEFGIQADEDLMNCRTIAEMARRLP